MKAPGRNDPCPCGRGRKYKKCCLDGDRLADRVDLYQFVPDDPAWTTLLVETPTGVIARRIPPAMPLRLGRKAGEAAEEATYGAAALWGLPDFVFRPALRSLGSGTRELGDGTLLVGELGIVVQVKTREAPSDDAEREARWIRKQTARALRQARGTTRQLCREPETMTNGRGHAISVDGNNFRWLSVVVIDHDDPPPGTVPTATGELRDAVVLLRRDWEFLFVQLKSTHAVGHYLGRVAGDPIELGTEFVRYYQLALADASAEPSGLDSRFQIAGRREVSTPLLPLAPAATDDDAAHHLFRSLFEDIAGTRLVAATESQRIRILAELDRLPVSERAGIGSFLRDSFASVAAHDGDGVVWGFRRFIGGLGPIHLAFAVCSEFNQQIQDAFSAWVQLRHHEYTQRLGPDGERPVTVGVLLTPRHDGGRPWDTTVSAVLGPLDLSPDQLAAFREVWNDELQATRGELISTR